MFVVVRRCRDESGKRKSISSSAGSCPLCGSVTVQETPMDIARSVFKQLDEKLSSTRWEKFSREPRPAPSPQQSNSITTAPANAFSSKCWETMAPCAIDPDCAKSVHNSR